MKKFKPSAFVFAFAAITLLSTNAQAVLAEKVQFVNSAVCFSTIHVRYQNDGMELDKCPSQEQTWNSDATHFKLITGSQKICDHDGGFTTLLLLRAIQSYAQNALKQPSNEISLEADGWTPWCFRHPLEMPGDPPLEPNKSPLKEDEMLKAENESQAKKLYRIAVMEKWVAETKQSWNGVPEMQKWEPQLIRWENRTNQKPLMQKWVAETKQGSQPDVTKSAAKKMHEWVASMQSWTKEMKNREPHVQKWKSQMTEWENVLNKTKMKEWSLIKNSLLASLFVFSKKVPHYRGYSEHLSEKLQTIMEELKSLKEDDLPEYSIFSKLGAIIQDYLVELSPEKPKVDCRYSASPRYPEPTPFYEYGITDLSFTIPAYSRSDAQPIFEADFNNLFKSFENESKKFLIANDTNSDRSYMSEIDERVQTKALESPARTTVAHQHYMKIRARD